MVTLASLAFAYALSAAPTPDPPLAAALVIDGKLALADVPTRTLHYFDLKDVVPGEADLSIDKKQIVFNGRVKGGGASRLYLLDPATGAFHLVVVPLEGDQRFPRFADDGAALVFSAPKLPGPDTHSNRDQLRKLTLASGKLESIETDLNLCDLSPVAWGHQKIAYVSTSCFIGFELKLKDLRRKKAVRIADLSGLRAELTVSPDGKKLVYANPERDGLKFYLVKGKDKPKLLTSLRPSDSRLQPRFVCPRDVLFVNDKRIWALNSDTGGLTDLMGISSTESEAIPKGEAPAEVAHAGK